MRNYLNEEEKFYIDMVKKVFKLKKENQWKFHSLWHTYETIIIPLFIQMQLMAFWLNLSTYIVKF